MKRTLPCLLLILLLLPLFLTSCGAHVKDTNGEDTALCELTDERILAKAPSHVATAAVSSSFDQKQTLRVNKLSGVYAFPSHLATDSTLTVTLTTTLYEGNLRAVLLCDGEYVQDIPVGEAQTVTVKGANGRYQVRLAAESAKLDAELQFAEE